MKLNTKIIFVAFMFFLTFLNLVSAQGFGYSNPLDLVYNNEWFMFGLFFLVFFAIIFYATNKAFRDNRAVALVVAAVAGAVAPSPV